MYYEGAFSPRLGEPQSGPFLALPKAKSQEPSGPAPTLFGLGRETGHHRPTHWGAGVWPMFWAGRCPSVF